MKSDLLLVVGVVVLAAVVGATKKQEAPYGFACEVKEGGGVCVEEQAWNETGSVTVAAVDLEINAEEPEGGWVYSVDVVCRGVKVRVCDESGCAVQQGPVSCDIPVSLFTTAHLANASVTGSLSLHGSIVYCPGRTCTHTTEDDRRRRWPVFIGVLFVALVIFSLVLYVVWRNKVYPVTAPHRYHSEVNDTELASGPAPVYGSQQQPLKSILKKPGSRNSHSNTLGEATEATRLPISIT